jgi:O-antigen ligase
VIVSHALAQTGSLLLALLAAVVLGAVPARERLRHAALLATGLLTPALLLATVWQTRKLHSLRAHPALAIAAALAAIVLVALLALAFARRPALLGPLAVLALPFRIPIGSGSARSDLLLPLYGVIAAAVLAQLSRRGARPLARGGALERVLAASLVLYAVQAFYTSDPTKAVEQMTFFYVPFAILYVLLRGLRWDAAALARCMRVLVSLALLFVAVGAAEYAARRLLLNAPLSAALSNQQYFRVNSLFYDPNIYGRFLALTMVALAAVMLWTPLRATTTVCAALLALLWVGLIISVSQSSIAALLAGLVVLAALRFGLRGTAAAASAGLLGALVVLAVAAGAIHLNLGSSAAANTSLNGRYSLVRGGLDLFAKRPFAGFGSGSFAHEFVAHGYAAASSTTESHTTPVTIAAEQGVIGLLLYAALLYAALRRLFSAGVRESVARAAIAAAVAALLVHTLAYADFLEDPAAWALLAVGGVLARTNGAARSLAAAPPG